MPSVELGSNMNSELLGSDAADAAAARDGGRPTSPQAPGERIVATPATQFAPYQSSEAEQQAPALQAYSVQEHTALQEEERFLDDKIEKLRRNHGPEILQQKIGVALSGGGVRAAAFHCGLLWALSSKNLMKDVLHLASVSGGAYTAASFATHLIERSETEERPRTGELDAWYKRKVANTILRMQHNINYLIRLGSSGDETRCFSDYSKILEAGRGWCPKLLDGPMFILTILSSMVFSPMLVFVNITWPLVLCIEHSLGADLRETWCDPTGASFSRKFYEWSKLRLMMGTGGMLIAAVVLAVLGKVGACKANPPHYKRYLFRRSLQQVLVRGALCYTLFLSIPWAVLLMQNISWGVRGMETGAHGSAWSRYHCWKHINNTAALPSQTCSDSESGGSFWYEKGGNPLYLNQDWVQRHGIENPWGIDPGGATQYCTSWFIAVNGIVAGAGVLGLFINLPLLQWYLTLAGPLWIVFLVAQVAQWRVFGPVTGQALIASNILRYTDQKCDFIFTCCVAGAVVTLPIYDILIKLMHHYYRASLQKAYFHRGKDVEISKILEDEYCPNLLMNACVNDYRRPTDKELLCELTLGPLFMGCTRTGFFRTDRHTKLGYLMSVCAAAPDTFMLTKFDVLPIRFLLSVMSIRLGDFLRLEHAEKAAQQVGRAVDNIGDQLGLPEVQRKAGAAQNCAQQTFDRAIVALPFIACHGLVMLGQHFDTAGQCSAYNFLLQVGLIGFLVVLVLSFFAFHPWIRLLMRSPLVLQFQMMFMHRHRAAKPPPYIYLSDGGLIECLGVLMLLRRRLELIICTDACEDADVTLRALRDTVVLARQEGICSFFDVDNPERDVELTLSDVKSSNVSFVELGIRYESKDGQQQVPLGRLLYIRMRLAEGDKAAERGVLDEEELLRGPEMPVGSAFQGASQACRASLGTPSPRREMNGVCCEGLCWQWLGKLGARRFPDFGTGNQFLQPRHFANLCSLGAEMSLPALKRAAELRHHHYP